MTCKFRARKPKKRIFEQVGNYIIYLCVRSPSVLKIGNCKGLIQEKVSFHYLASYKIKTCTTVEVFGKCILLSL